MQWGDGLPAVRGPVPGPRSKALAQRLARVESPNVTSIADDTPIFWQAASGANVRDVDGNIYVDLTAGFGVAFAGHANANVTQALADQVRTLPHALGDVYPADVKVDLLEILARTAPGDLAVSILASAGAEAVEAALKTAAIATGRHGVLAFEGAYHGLTYGALGTTAIPMFRAPFEPQLFPGVRFAPFPQHEDEVVPAIDSARALLEDAEPQAPIGAILVEPIQGRGGLRVPPPTFLQALRELCDGRSRLLILDEVYTGFGRTGRMFACEHSGIVPDLLVVGKALSGTIPIAAAIGTEQIMAAWPRSDGEAIHTSTFLGNPAACAAAIAQINEIRQNRLVERAALLGARIRERLDKWVARFPFARAARGLGLLQGVVLNRAETQSRALRVASEALAHGVIVLAEGPEHDVLAITPPAVIREDQLEHALGVIEEILATC